MRRAIALWVVALGVGCSSSPSSDGGQPDSGSGVDGGSRQDAGTDARVDAGVDAGPPGLTCGMLLSCDQHCPSDAGGCTDGCFADSTAVAQGLFDAFDNCLNGACPSTDGGACADPNSSTCSNCDQNAAVTTCVTNLEACSADMVVGPPNPDGGVTVPDGGTTNCGELIACAGACGTDAGCVTACDDEATPEARALNGVLAGCLATACPSTDGGPCAMPGTTCNGCVEQVEFGGVCATPYQSCINDTSNTGDGGYNPMALNGGTLATVLTGTNQIGASMIVRDGYLYYAQLNNSGQVSRMSLADGGITPLGPVQPSPVGLAVNSTDLYVLNYGTFDGGTNFSNFDGHVDWIPLDGGAQVVINASVQVFFSAPYLNAIAVDQNHVYWVTGASGNDGAIMRSALDGGGVAVFQGSQYLPEAVVTDGTNVYWTNWGTFDAQGNSKGDGTVMQAPVDGGAAILLASGQWAPGCMAIDSAHVYWTNIGLLGASNLPALNSGSVMQASIGGGGLVTLASQQSVPIAIAVDGGTVYWTEYGFGAPGLVLSVPVDGGTVVPLVAGLLDPYSLALSSDTLFYSLYVAATPTMNTPLIQSLTPY